MKQLLNRKNVTEVKITALDTLIVSIAQTSLKEIERLHIDIVKTNNRLEIWMQ